MAEYNQWVHNRGPNNEVGRFLITVRAVPSGEFTTIRGEQVPLYKTEELFDGSLSEEAAKELNKQIGPRPGYALPCIDKCCSCTNEHPCCMCGN